MNLKNKFLKQKSLLRPFVYSRPSVSSIVIRILILLLIQIFMLFFTDSFQSLKIVGLSVLGAFCAAILNYFIFKEPLYNIFYMIIQGIIIGLFLPSSYPVFIVFIISFITIFVSRCVIFQNITSWFNPCAVAVVIAWFIGKTYFPQFIITSDLLSVKNPSVYLIQEGVFPIYNFDRAIISFLNTKVFSLLKTSVPEGILSILWDNQSVIPAFRFNLITLFSSIIIFSDKAFSSVIPFLFLSVYVLLVRFFAPIFYGGNFNQGDILLALFSSGTIFGAVYLFQTFGTVPMTLFGKIIYGILAGIIYFLLAGCGTSPIAMVYTVLIMNIINIMIKAIEEYKNKLKIIKANPQIVKEATV